MAHHDAPLIVNMTKRQCAEWLNVGTSTIERWRENEGLPYIQLGGVTRYPLADVDAWWAKRKKVNVVKPPPVADTVVRKTRTRRAF